MTVLRARAPGKVNLALYLGPVRAQDGKHELVSFLEPVTLADWVELGPARGGADEVRCEGVEGPNLAADAPYYYSRPQRDDIHGYGPVLLAGLASPPRPRGGA